MHAHDIVTMPPRNSIIPLILQLNSLFFFYLTFHFIVT